VPKPVLQALVLADQVYQDKVTNKFIIAGTFNQLHLRKKPSSETTVELPKDKDAEEAAEGLRKVQLSEAWVSGSPFVYISLTNIRGQAPLELRYVDLNDYIVMLSFPFAIQAKSPLDTIEVSVRLPVLPAPHPGVYALELLSDNEVLGSHRVTAIDGATDQKSGEEEK